MDETARRFHLPVLAATALLLAGLAAPAAAQVAYTRNANGGWNTATQWTPTGVPGPGDYASLAGRTVTLDSDTEVAGLAVNGGTAVLGGSGTLTVTERMTWQAGILQGTGAIVVAADAELVISGEASRGLREQRILHVLGSTDWSSTRRISNSNESHFINEGTATITAGLAEPDALFFGGIFSNRGTLVVDSPGVYDFASFFHNEGSVDIQAGRLLLRGFNANGGTDSGSYVIAAGAALDFGGGNRNLTASASVDGEGRLEASAGNTWVAGSVDVAMLRMVQGGTLNLDGDTAVDTLELAGSGTLGGSGDITVRDSLLWSGGDLHGSGSILLEPGVPAVFSGSLSLFGSRSLRLQGPTEWTAGTSFSNHNEATLVNAGTLSSSGAGERVFFGGTFRNEGTLLHDGGTLRFTARFDNVGVVEVAAGTLVQRGFNATGGTEAGSTLVRSGAELHFSGGNRTLANTAVLAGSGGIVHSGGNLQHAATVAPGGSGPGTLAWTAGTYAPLADAHLAMDVAGTAPGSGHDLLAVDGDVVLGGSLDVQFTDGFTPGPADTFVLLTASGTVTGAFAATSLPAGYVLQLEPDAVVLRPAVLQIELFRDGFEAALP